MNKFVFQFHFNDSLSFFIALSLAIHAMLFIYSWIAKTNTSIDFKEYQMVSLFDSRPKGMPRVRSKEISISSNPNNDSASLPAKTEPAADTSEEGVSDGQEGESDFSSYPGFSTVLQLPSFKVKFKPVYPEAARSKGIECEVLAEIYIDSKGTPRKVVILRSGGSDFDQAVSDAVMRSIFSPAIAKNGDPVPVKVRIPFKFELE